MIEEIKNITNEIISIKNQLTTKNDLEDFKLKYLVKKGIIQSLFLQMKDVPKEEKKDVGLLLNKLKQDAEQIYDELNKQFEEKEANAPTIDLSLPGRSSNIGTKHPVTQTIDLMIEIFRDMGFAVAEGPDIEDGYHNFDALNFPPDHPARDMQDTFFIKSDKELVLRTHTSPVQIRVMENMKPPIKTIMPGRVYRNESLDATHLAEFHQIEGLYIDENVSMAELKAMMMTFAKKLYGDNLEFRFRPSFFPFTEPSAEMDIRRPGTTKWMEVVGCGMVHPNVLNAGGIDSEKYSGFAFGFGIERITMIRTSLDDIRALYENDIRVLKQF
jgi:phenylalanyl-tRNA synthetase alpha chain